MSDRFEGPIEILHVEDNPGDVRLLRDAFDESSTAVTIRVATDGEAAFEELGVRNEAGPPSLPHLVLLDLDLPRTDGFEFLETVRSKPVLAHLPVLVLTDSEANEDVLESYELAANAYLTKPTDPDEYGEMVNSVVEFWFEQVMLPPPKTYQST
ncbi:response regulator [Natrialba swarupiae]|uniref:Response regulator n=1 Tax=Natrialba swarupiae TaxID=2448032 RepID=A0A5D5AR89_9EURY|nr:response regulator [Natrialba swarupiae]TYT63435.1 response regulator [Natrialba swarupiae]